MTPSNQPQRVLSEDELRNALNALYNESRAMGMLRQGSPITHMIDGAIALFTQQLAVRSREAQNDAKLSGVHLLGKAINAILKSFDMKQDLRTALINAYSQSVKAVVEDINLEQEFTKGDQ